jgi:myo-inositol-1(or 4)-monophosphatase
VVSNGRDADAVMAVLHRAGDAVGRALRTTPEWGLTGQHAGQHHSDLVADAAARSVIEQAGFGVLSEESGVGHTERDVVVVLDPLDGSTNAAQGIPWFATSLCAVDAQGPFAALVVDLVRGARFEAVRGRGARRDGQLIEPSSCTSAGDAIVGLSGWPPVHLGWRQFRALGAVALDLCAVASGVLDGVVDCSPDAHGVWDYAGAMLVCREAGAVITDAMDRELLVLDHAARRTPVAAATASLHSELVAARRQF